jgi:hypothetical protein
MITKYRNRAALRLSIGFCMFFGGLCVVVLTQHGPSERIGGFFGVVSGGVGYLLFVFGCVDLLKAKGYDSSISLAFIIPAVCCSLAFIFFAPLVIIFGLQDKTKNRR